MFLTLGILPEQIFADGWAIGYDDRFPKHIRVQQAPVFARLSEHENLYAHPMVFFILVFADTLYANPNPGSRTSLLSLILSLRKSFILTSLLTTKYLPKGPQP